MDIFIFLKLIDHLQYFGEQCCLVFNFVPFLPFSPCHFYPLGTQVQRLVASQFPELKTEVLFAISEHFLGVLYSIALPL